MKKVNFILLVVIAVLCVSCNTAKKEQTVSYQKEASAQEITVPFFESKYQTDNDYFRAKNNGKSPDMATAKKIALTNAKSEMAGAIQTLVKAVTDQYTSQYTVATSKILRTNLRNLHG